MSLSKQRKHWMTRNAGRSCEAARMLGNHQLQILSSLHCSSLRSPYYLLDQNKIARNRRLQMMGGGSGSTVVVVDPNVSTDTPVDYIPASIEHNGREAVDVYFRPFVQPSKEDKDVLENSLRGYPMHGQKMRMPDGYEALVLQAGRGDGLGERGSKCMRAVLRTDKITYWNYDKVPSDTDQLKQALSWTKYAHILHEQDDEEDEKENKQDK